MAPKKTTPPTAAARIEYVPLAEIKRAKNNPKDHDLGALQASLDRFGYVDPVLVDERTGRLVKGHGRLELLAKLEAQKAQPPRGVQLNDAGEWLVPVVRGWSSRNDQEAGAYLLADNRISELGGWHDDQLQQLLAELQSGEGLLGTGYDGDDLDDLIRTLEGKGDVDAVPDPPADPWVKLGDLFQLGVHRIICGDSTEPGVVDRLLSGAQAEICWTDPPWNVAYDGKASIHKGAARQHAKIANDDMGEKFPAFCAAFCEVIKRATKPGASLYLAMSGSEWPVIDGALRAAGFHWSSTIVWAKDSFVIGRRDYHSQYEPVWYGWNGDAPRLCPIDDRTQSDLWPIPRPKRSEDHPTMKPVELIVRALRNSSRPGDLVFEPFSGSGSTLIACEDTGRACRAVELSPAYVQVAIERWQKLTGKQAKKLGADAQTSARSA